MHLVVPIDAYDNGSHTMLGNSSNYTNTTVLAETDDFSIFGFSTLYSILGSAGAGLVLVIIIVIIIAVALKTPATVNDKEESVAPVTQSAYCIVCQGEEPVSEK